MPRFLIFLLALSAHAEPIIVGYERAPSGKLLFNELGCANCHSEVTGLPARRGPVLPGITQRIKAGWLRQFIADPAKTKPGTAMPHFVVADQAEAILHYLSQLPAPAPPKAKGAKYLNAERGSDVFHTVGCAACHQPRSDYQPPAGSPSVGEFSYCSVPLPELQAKYSLASMTAFLTNPLRTRPDGRMPHTALDDGDVSDLAAYMMDYKQSDGTGAVGIPKFERDDALAKKGKALVESLRCAACHDLPGKPAAKRPAIKSPEGGCLSNSPAADLPHYDLSQTQRQALADFLREPSKSTSAADQATLSLQALNCLACHERDGGGGPDSARKAYFTGDASLGDTGRFPPPLTAAGRKLQPDWMKEVLAGKARVRPYLQTKMPQYGSATDGLPALFATADAKPEKPLPPGDTEAGRKLLGTAGGIGCTTCHRWEKRPSLGIQALDLSSLAHRVQPGWLRDYLLDPTGYRAGTLMPSFWPKGVAANTTVLHGDTDAQIASILAFAMTGKGEPEGYPAVLAGEFELIPKDRPIVQRTFLKGVGTQAILVGFAAGIHLAYDAQHAQPAKIWTGKFFDAYNTWFTRAAPFEEPLGQTVASWPVSKAITTDVQFLGYKLDAARVPTFLSAVRQIHVSDRFEPKAGAMQRSVEWDSSALPDFQIAHPEGVRVTEMPGSAAGHRLFIYSWK